MFSTARITDAQLHAMWGACGDISTEIGARLACRKLSERLSAIISAPAIVFRRDVSPWRLVANSTPESGEDWADSTPDSRELDQLVASPEACYQVLTGRNQERWTPVPLDEDVPWQSMLLLPGDWQVEPLAQWLPRFARTASMALRLAAARETARTNEALAVAAYSLARKLGQISGERVLHQFIVDSAAKMANARLGGFSVYRQQDAAIAVAATYGYPSEAVGHVRIAPGTGIIGGVFSSKKPVLVRDTTRVPGLTPRSRRYQTASFMALPVLAGREALGVVTLADRVDGRPFSRGDLAAARIVTAVSALALVREQLSQRGEELAHAAAVDAVTGMFNRRYLHTRLEAEIERSRRDSVPICLLMLDLDTFKAINDEMGHQRGDAVLRKVAEIVRRSVRASDVCTRYGGDEFAVIVPGAAESALHTAERIRSRVEAFRWDALGIPQNLHVTVSVGIGIGQPGEDADALIGRSDQNLYFAKTMGRNAVFPHEVV